MDINDVERIHPLSPVQDAILMGSRDPRSACGQLDCLLEGPLDVDAFKNALAQSVHRNAVFRTFFLWRRVDRPLQVIQRKSLVAPEQHDWRELSEDQQREGLQAYLQTDRAHGFDLDKPPLVRLSLCRLDDASYRLIFTYHRAILDGRSAAAFLTELLTLQASSPPEVYSPGASYGTYLSWLKDWGASEADDYWRRTLKDVGPPTRLAIERFSANTQGEAGNYAEQQRWLPSDLVVRIQQVASARGLKAGTLLHAAWALLLNRYVGDQDLLFGTAVDTCPAHLEKSGPVLGPLTNMLPMRVRVTANDQVRDWLRMIETQMRGVKLHGHSSLSRIYSLSTPSLAAPLFESCVSYRENRLSDAARSFGNLVLRELREVCPEFAIVISSNFDLSAVQMSYERARFEDRLIAQMLDHIQVLLCRLTEEADLPLAEVNLLTEAEQRKLLLDWNDTGTGYPQSRCVHQLFEAQVKRTPNSTAVVFEEECVSYQELNERANRLAHYLQGLGIGPDVLVALCMERSVEIIVAILGILKAGGAWVPLDPAYPSERLAFMLDDAQPPVLLTQERVLDRLPSYWGQVVCVDAIRGDLGVQSGENPASTVSGNNLAYIVYTSGSTGKPKGAMIHHRGICNTSEHMVEAFDQRHATRILQFASISFDMSVFEIIPALISGAALYLARQDTLFGDDLAELLLRNKIQALTIPPSVLATVPQVDLPELEIIRVAGEAVTAELVARWLPGRRLYNAYGPAECSIWVSGAFLDGGRSSNIGRPIANTQIYVLDPALRPVPVGVPGELCIGGVGVGRGYLNRPDLTAEKFVPNPFGHGLGGRLYKTGDIVRYLPGGDIEFIGRVDNQVKIHGFRIELGEIENTLTTHPHVRHAVVVPRDDGAGEKRLVAYVATLNGQGPAATDLRRYLQTYLPDPMIPSAFIALERIPLTANGKIDVAALPAPECDRAKLDTPFVTPRNETEEAIASIFADVLGLEQVGATDNFFDLGGHSLLAAQLVSRIRGAFSIELPLAQIFRRPTPAELSEVLASTPGRESDIQPPITAIPRKQLHT